MTNVHPLDDVRGLQEEGKTSAEWLAIARIQVERTLLATGYFPADDLAPLGIPEQYRRSIHGSVTGFYSAPGYMVEVGREKSRRPERKGAKNTVYRLTEKGRQELSKLAGSSAGGSEPTDPAAERLAHMGERHPRPCVASGEHTGGGETPRPEDNGGSPPEPLSLFDYDSPRAA